MDDLSPQDLNNIARVVNAEAGNQGDEGMAAVAHVIRNRYLSGDPQYGNGINGILFGRNQFAKPTARSDDSGVVRAASIAKSVFSGEKPDPTSGALNFANVPIVEYQRSLSGKPLPDFFKYPQTAQIGAHTFFKPNASDLASEWLGPSTAPSAAQPSQTPSTSPDLASEWLHNAPATFAERAAEPTLQPPAGGFVQGLAHGATQAGSNILSRVGQAAQLEMGQPVDVPEPEGVFREVQRNITGPLTPGGGVIGSLGENIGGAAVYGLTMPQAGIGSAVTQAGLVGAGATLGEMATKGTSLEPYGGIIGGIAAPTAIPYLANKFFGGIGAAASGLLGRSTGVGEVPIGKAFSAGVSGGGEAEAFQAGLSGQVSPEELVDQARGALSKMHANRSTQYQNSIEAVKENTTPIAFDDIDSAMSKINETKVFRGQSGTATPQNIGKETQPIRDQINTEINNWRALDPNEYHTPIGLDALKQSLGEIKDAQQIGTPQWKVASDSYNAVRSAIVKNAPEYANVMKDYESASDQLDEIRRTLSLGKTATDDTAFRKLMSVMRNNVNTNYGRRSELVSALEQHGAPHLSAALAGQALNAPFARGLTGNILGGLAIPAAIEAYQQGGMKGVAALTAALPFQSPRLIGTVTHGLGRAYGALPNMNATPLPLRAFLNQRQKLSNANVPALAGQ